MSDWAVTGRPELPTRYRCDCGAIAVPEIACVKCGEVRRFRLSDEESARLHAMFAPERVAALRQKHERRRAPVRTGLNWSAAQIDAYDALVESFQ